MTVGGACTTVYDLLFMYIVYDILLLYVTSVVGSNIVDDVI